ncbi:MAG TPA: DUF502 domain-containing protein [Rudaea sp.]
MPKLYLQRYLITGLLTFVPLYLTWLVFKVVFSFLSHVGAPVVAGLFSALSAVFPGAAAWLSQEWFQAIVAFIATIVALYVIGFATSRVFGQRLLGAFENIIARIPFVQTIYGGSKKLMSVLSTKPAGMQRVVLIDFPSPELKSLGFVTRLFTTASGQELAAVYVPTTPNPTGGYLEVVPVEKLVATDWTMDQAMAFILSGGTVGPDTLPAGAHPADKAVS